MAVYEVYSQPELRRYRTHVCSKATILQLFCILLTFIPPLLIAYRSEGFWKRIDQYEEQPTVHYKHQLLVILHLRDGSYITWSTFHNFNILQENNIRVPLLKSREEDENRDGKYDKLLMKLTMPVLDTEEIVAVQMLLTFDYKLRKFSIFQMESLAYIHHTSVSPGASFQTTGDLRFYQREPLAHKGIDTRFNMSVIDGSSIYAQTYDLSQIFEEYTKRNVTTKFEDNYPVWMTGRGSGNPFSISITIRYPEEVIKYYPGFWQLIKWAWVQYLAVLLVFLFIFSRIKDFIFQNQLVPTLIDRPFKQHVH